MNIYGRLVKTTFVDRIEIVAFVNWWSHSELLRGLLVLERQIVFNVREEKLREYDDSPDIKLTRFGLFILSSQGQLMAFGCVWLANVR